MSAHFWFCTGTGDIHVAFQNHYEETSSKLLPQNRSRTHNQFMSMWIAFGIIGFLIFVLTQFYSLILFIKKKQFQSVLIWLVLITSFMTEDTLETQTGVTLVVFFISLLSALETHQTPANKNRL